jgi:hypothetical protein
LPKGLPEIQKTQQESTAAGKSAGTADQSASEFSIRLQFYRGGRLDTVTRLPAIQSQKSGLWRLLSYDETKKLATIECELMQQRTQHEVQFLDADTINLIPPNMAGLNVKLEFKRSR